MVLFRWIRKPIGSASALSPETDQSYRRFHRRGLLAALGLHALLPVLLTAPAWVPALFESAEPGSRQSKASALQQASEDELQASDPEGQSQPAAATRRSQLRIVFEPINARAAERPPALANADPAPPLQDESQPPLQAAAEGATAQEPLETSLAQQQAALPSALHDDALPGSSAAAQQQALAPLAASEASPRNESPNKQADAEPARDTARPDPAAAEAAAILASRKAKLEGELKALSERIQAYQRQQDKEAAERKAAEGAAPGGFPSEGNQPSQAASAPEPAPQSASREAIIEARLPVKLKAFQGAWKYKVYYGERSEDNLVALARFEVEVDQDLYVLRSQARPQGFAAVLFQGEFTQESRGRVSPWGYRPESYEEQRGQRGRRWAQMDWDQREVRLSDGARIPIAQGVQDQLSIAWQLSALAASQLARLQSPAGIQIPLILTRHVELNRFFAKAITEEMLDGQTLRLLKVEREPRQGKRDARIEVWLDVDRDMLPVRLRIEDRRGRIVEQVMQKD